jgi:hypothetical protein
MPKFYVRITHQYEVEAETDVEALANYEHNHVNVSIVNQEVFDENLDLVIDEPWGEDCNGEWEDDEDDDWPEDDEEEDEEG